MMDRARWLQLSALLDDVLALPRAERPAWLAVLRASDESLAHELAPMLAAADEAEQTDAQAGPAQLDDSGSGPGLPRSDATLPPAWLGFENRGFENQLREALQPEPALAADAPQPGQQLGAWMLLRKIGEGGMGQVWLARRSDGLYEAQAAIKLLRSDLTAAGLSGRFARERAALGRLNHPAVARLLDAGVAGDQAYLVLEYVDGQSLADFARTHCPSAAQRVQLLLRMAQAVEHAHAHLIVHRDLKPSNVLVTPEGELKLLDFGIAGLLDDGDGVDSELTRQTGRGLTLGYAAPEQILGAPIGTAADVFSLGVMLFELLSGELPFAPRGSSRRAAEHAVLHDEPRRLASLLGRRGRRSNATAVTAVTAPGSAPPTTPDTTPDSWPAALPDPGPGPVNDPAQVSGDLEAIVAKALRKEPAQRYASVRAFSEDLQRWLAHRPVLARREDWRHRTRLWFRRNALLAGALALVLSSLLAGLAAATWQWQRAETAAHQSEQVTSYLTDLLASSRPDRHGGRWPTVLQLLESSRSTLPQQFKDDPDTRLRLLQVLADTYHELNRFDISMPLYGELVALAQQRLGPDDPRTLLSVYGQARSYQVQGLFDKAISTLEPLQARYAQVFGPDAEEMRALLYVLSTSYGRAGRLDEADTMLARAGRLTESRYAAGSPQWMSHQNHLQVLRHGQGRVREALQAIQRTQPYWQQAGDDNLREVLVYRRNTIAIQVRLSEYDRIEERTQVLLADMDRLMGPGNDLSAGMRHELARYFTETAQHQRALQQRQDNLARAQNAQVRHPAALLPLQVQVLLAQAQAWGAAAGPGSAELKRQARQQLSQVQQQRAVLGYARADAWINLARVGLLLDDAALAAEALAPLKDDAGLQLGRDVMLASRVAQMEGELARLQGDLPRSAALLRQRTQLLFAPTRDQQLLPTWVAALDLAYTLVLMGDAGAPAALQAAAQRRPAGVRTGHPLDAVQAYLAARLAAGNDNTPEVRAALQALRVAQGRADGGPGSSPSSSPETAPANAGRGSLGGAFI